MIGAVNENLEAMLRVRVRGANQSVLDVECVIDTGFSGALTLNAEQIRALKLEWLTVQSVELADGSVVPSNIYLGEVDWQGQRQRIEIDEANTGSLLGMAILSGSELKSRSAPRGAGDRREPGAHRDGIQMRREQIPRLDYESPPSAKSSPFWVLWPLLSFVLVVVSSMFRPLLARDERRGNDSGSLGPP
jgi:predicted aspartyl protease